MTLEPMGVLDLSLITETLLDLLNNRFTDPQFWDRIGISLFNVRISGFAPDSIRKSGDCELSLFLFHVSPDRTQRNSAVTGARRRVPLVPFQPLSLDLYYLLSTYSETNWRQEQQAMGIAMRCFHEIPVLRLTASIPQGGGVTNVPEEFSLTMEVESVDELSRLWQAMTVPMRLGAVYKVSVVFITPEGSPPPAKAVTDVNLNVIPTALPAQAGQVFGTTINVVFIGPDDVPADPKRRHRQPLNLSPATVAAGQALTLYGANMNTAPFTQVYLVAADNSEVDVTGWKAAAPLQTATRVLLTLPNNTGPAPGGTPPAGVYQLRVGNGKPLGDPLALRSNGTPFSLSARVDIPPAADPPILGPTGGPFTLTGAGFIAGQTQVLLDTVLLGAGDFNIATGASLTFNLPVNLPPGRYPVRVRVNGVESVPYWWVIKP